MKVILYMATTVNGIIAKHDDSAPFLTEVESNSYVANVKAAGGLIIGRKTYQVLSQQPEFQEFLKANVRIVVVSNSAFEVVDEAHKVTSSPKEAVELLGDLETVVLAGGGILNASFLAENLVDEIYIDIEPAILGKGIPIFNGEDFEQELKLLGVKNISENEVQLHYQVVK